MNDCVAGQDVVNEHSGTFSLFILDNDISVLRLAQSQGVEVVSLAPTLAISTGS